VIEVLNVYLTLPGSRRKKGERTMRFLETSLDGARLIERAPVRDERGFFRFRSA
jgi:hypothetical protein